jgi:arylsulfatase A-like enzyme
MRVGTLFGLLLLAVGCSESEPDPRPSILLVVIDTLRADAVSAYGQVEGTTPALDRLAAQGLLYRNAFSPAPWTLPSHATLLTGLDVTRHGVGIRGRMVLRPEVSTLAERLREAGYVTAGFSENLLVSPTFGFSQGFEHLGSFDTRKAVAALWHGEPTDFALMEDVRRWSQRVPAEGPLFVFVNLYDPHEPYTVRESNPFLPAGFSPEENRATLSRPLGMCDDLPSPEILAAFRGLYLGDVAAADAKIDPLRTIMRKLRPRGELITVVTSDHGEHLGEHGLLGHEFTVHDTALHVPLVVHGLPGTAPGEITEAVELADVAGSILVWAGIRTQADPDPLPVEPGAADPSRPLFAFYDDHEFQAPEVVRSIENLAASRREQRRAGCPPEHRMRGDQRAIVRYPFKLIASADHEPQLYDLSWDPEERSDLAAYRPELVAELQQQLDAFDAELTRSENAAPTSPEAIEALRALGYVD